MGKSEKNLKNLECQKYSVSKKLKNTIQPVIVGWSSIIRFMTSQNFFLSIQEVKRLCSSLLEPILQKVSKMSVTHLTLESCYQIILLENYAKKIELLNLNRNLSILVIIKKVDQLLYSGFWEWQ